MVYEHQKSRAGVSASKNSSTKHHKIGSQKIHYAEASSKTNEWQAIYICYSRKGIPEFERTKISSTADHTVGKPM